MKNEKLKKYLGKPLIWTGMGLWMLLLFVIGMTDRVILVFMPWQGVPSLFKGAWYTSHAEAAIIRVVVVGLLIGAWYLIF